MIAGIISYTGYTGFELLKILNHHPLINKIYLFSNSISNINGLCYSFANYNKFHLYARQQIKLIIVMLYSFVPEGIASIMQKIFDKKINH